MNMEPLFRSHTVGEGFEDHCFIRFELGGEANAAVLLDPKRLADFYTLSLLFRLEIVLLMYVINVIRFVRAGCLRWRCISGLLSSSVVGCYVTSVLLRLMVKLKSLATVDNLSMLHLYDSLDSPIMNYSK